MQLHHHGRKGRRRHRDLQRPGNIRADAPWYLINDDTQNNGEGFRFACAAILGPKIIKLKAMETMRLHYRVGLSPKAWTPEGLKTMQEQWLKPNVP